MEVMGVEGGGGARGRRRSVSPRDEVVHVPDPVEHLDVILGVGERGTLHALGFGERTKDGELVGDVLGGDFTHGAVDQTVLRRALDVGFLFHLGDFVKDVVKGANVDGALDAGGDLKLLANVFVGDVEKVVRLGGDQEASEAVHFLAVKDAPGDDDDDKEVYNVQSEGNAGILEEIVARVRTHL